MGRRFGCRGLELKFEKGRTDLRTDRSSCIFLLDPKRQVRGTESLGRTFPALKTRVSGARESGRKGALCTGTGGAAGRAGLQLRPAWTILTGSR